MSLWKMQQYEDTFPYLPCSMYDGDPNYVRRYHLDHLCIETNPYFERWQLPTYTGGWTSSVFWYWPNQDYYALTALFDNVYTNTAAAGIVLNASDGDLILNERTGSRGFSIFNPWGLYRIGGITVGNFNFLYTIDRWLQEILEYKPDGTASGWTFDLKTLPSYPNNAFDKPTHVIFDKTNGYLVVCGWPNAFGSQIHFWKNVNTTPEKMGYLQIPSNALFSAAWESETYFWVVWKGGGIAKINLPKMRFELMSSVDQPDPTDVRYLGAWDTKRGYLAIMRHQADGAGGEAHNRLELYAPIPKPYIITNPVPMNVLRANELINFSFHLVGDKGEGLSPYRVDANLQAPIDGELSTHTTQTREYGWGLFQYRAPDMSCVDTIEISANITEGPTT